MTHRLRRADLEGEEQSFCPGLVGPPVECGGGGDGSVRTPLFEGCISE